MSKKVHKCKNKSLLYIVLLVPAVTIWYQQIIYKYRGDCTVVKQEPLMSDTKFVMSKTNLSCPTPAYSSCSKFFTFMNFCGYVCCLKLALNEFWLKKYLPVTEL